MVKTCFRKSIHTIQIPTVVSLINKRTLNYWKFIFYSLCRYSQIPVWEKYQHIVEYLQRHSRRETGDAKHYTYKKGLNEPRNVSFVDAVQIVHHNINSIDMNGNRSIQQFRMKLETDDRIYQQCLQSKTTLWQWHVTCVLSSFQQLICHGIGPFRRCNFSPWNKW